MRKSRFHLEKLTETFLGLGCILGASGIFLKLRYLVGFALISFMMYCIMQLIIAILHKEISIRGTRFAGKSLYAGVGIILVFLIIFTLFTLFSLIPFWVK